MTSSPSPPSWAHKVSWERADIFQPTTYAPLLNNADYVVHSMGILLEADYKGVVSGQESPIAGLRKAFSPEKSRITPNPLERGGSASGEGEYKKPESEAQLTYEAMNRDSALLLARAAAEAGTSAFVYISAAGGAPVLPARYIETKREAESLIASEFPKVRGIFVRAPFLYDSSRFFTIPMAGITGATALFNGVTGGIFGGLLGAAAAKPLKADVVARAAVEALEDGKTRGPVEVSELEDLAEKAWRKGML